MGQGSKTGRTMGYCSGSDSPGYMTGGPAGAFRGAGGGAGRGMGRGAGRGACRGFRCRKTPGFGRGGGFVARGEYPGYYYPGYYYPAPSQSQIGSEADSLENRIKLLKQELETLDGKLKTLKLQESSVEE
ncbi:hypothetical protein MSWH1_3065 [Methanosarcina sp. WH1]|nr:hypothetical protein MSWH1_3065 [Methanosarcina sp. WH1]